MPTSTTYEIDQVTWQFPACRITRLFGVVSEIKVPTTVYYYRTVYPSGNKYEDSEIYLSEQDVKLAISQQS